MSLWTRKRTAINDRAGPDDWTVIYAGEWQVGRISADDSRLCGPFWKWATWTYPAERGTVPTLEEAQEAVKAAVVIRNGAPMFGGSAELYRVPRHRDGMG